MTAPTFENLDDRIRRIAREEMAVGQCHDGSLVAEVIRAVPLWSLPREPSPRQSKTPRRNGRHNG